MPAYIRRPHDETLRTMLDPEVAGSRLIVIRGEAGTGKSRAAYEAVAARLGDWSLEYPPTAAALAARLAAGIPAWTVLWLGELRQYADADGGGAALSGLAELLESDGHMVITTLWPEHWDAYVTAAGARRGARDPLRVAGRLVAGLDELALMADPDPAYGGVIDVPARFTAEQLTAAAVRGDQVLAAAAAAAGPDGHLTQHLAGGPALLRRYDGPGGDPGGQAIVTAAMDAARLGHAGPLPAAFLRDAATGYLATPPAAARGGSDGVSGLAATRADEDALAWASALLDGAVRALDPVPAAVPVPAAADAGLAGYRIAGYLDQHGRRSRQDRRGPASLWDALAARAAGIGVSDLTRIGQAARDRGLYRHAAVLWTAAVSAGSADAARRLVAHLRAVNPPDVAPAAAWAAGRVELDDPWDLARLLDELLAAETGDAVRALLDRDPAAQVSIDDRWDAIELLRALHAAGAAGAVGILAGRLVADVSLENLPSVASLLTALHAAGAEDAVRALVARDPARHAIAEEPEEAALLLEALHAAGAADAARALARWAATDAILDRPQVLTRLLKALRTVGADGALRVLLARDPVGHGSFDDLWEAAALLAELRAAEAGDAVRALLARDPASSGHIDYPDSVAWLLGELRAARAGEAMADEAVRTLLARNPGRHADLYEPQAVGRLAAELHACGDIEGVRTLATRVAGWIPPDDPEYLAEWLEEFRGAGAAEAVPILLAGDPAGRVGLGHPGHVAWLLEELHAASASASAVASAGPSASSGSSAGPSASSGASASGAGASDAVRTLLARDPARQARLDHPPDVARLLRALRVAGAGDAATALAARAAAGISLENPQGTAWLLEELQRAGDDGAVQALLARDPAARVSLGPGQQRSVARLLQALRAAGAVEAARTLAARAADAGMFGLEPDQAADRFGLQEDRAGDRFGLQEDRAGDRFGRSGREPDGAPAPPWHWVIPPLAQ